MNGSSAFLSAWDRYMYLGTIVFLVAGVLILLYHEFQIFRIRSYKDKYDYVILHEIKYFWYAIMSFIFAAVCFANTIGTETIASEGMRWFYVRIFIVLSMMLIAYFIFFSLLRVYYPKLLAKRLTRLRNKPRISPAGNKMRKLSEDEEDHHLEASQIEEEKIQLVDYDVWIDERTGYKSIEKYPVRRQAEECPECGYYTMKIAREEIEKAPTEAEKGLLLEHYKCSYCGHRELREVVVARLSSNM